MKHATVKNYKLLETVHGIGQIDEYYHVRAMCSGEPDVFTFAKITITENGRYEVEISSDELPENAKLL